MSFIKTEKGDGVVQLELDEGLRLILSGRIAVKCIPENKQTKDPEYYIVTVVPNEKGE